MRDRTWTARVPLDYTAASGTLTFAPGETAKTFAVPIKEDTLDEPDETVILRLSGAEGTQSEKMRHFADEVQAHFDLKVHLWDERWTSTEANRLLRESELSIEKRAKAVDRMAAVLILQSWLEARRSRNENGPDRTRS